MEFLKIFSLFLFIILSNILIKNLRKSLTNPRILPKSKLPPGPWKLPIIGNLHQLYTSLPHRALRDLSEKYGPLMFLQIGQVPAVIVSSPELVEQVTKTHDALFTSRPSNMVSKTLFYDSTSISFSPCGEYWREARKMCTQELLSSAKVKTFRTIREEETANLVESMASKADGSFVINLSEKLNSLTYCIASRAAFGLKSPDQEEFIESALRALKAGAGLEFGDLFPSLGFLDAIFSGTRSDLERIRVKIDKIVGNIIKERREKKDKGEDQHNLLDALLRVYDSDESGFSLTMSNVKALISEIFVAGGETSASTLEWAMSELIKNPQIMKKTQHEVRETFNRIGIVDEAGIDNMKYLKSVIKETLRLHCPAPLLLPRQCEEKCEINGYELPPRTRVIINAWAIAMDRRSWTDPERFSPERFVDSSIDFKGTNYEFVPFGAGRRMCPGFLFGSATVELILALLLYHFDWKLPNGMKHEDLDMDEYFGLGVKRKRDLYLIPVVYKCP